MVVRDRDAPYASCQGSEYNTPFAPYWFKGLIRDTWPDWLRHLLLKLVISNYSGRLAMAREAPSQHMAGTELTDRTEVSHQNKDERARSKVRSVIKSPAVLSQELSSDKEKQTSPTKGKRSHSLGTILVAE